MKKYMVVYVVEGEQGAAFFDDLNKVQSFTMDTACGLGGTYEVYERQEETEDLCAAYEFLYS